MGRAALDGENLSEQVTFKMSFELQERASHITVRRKSIPSRGRPEQRSGRKREFGKLMEQKETQCGWSTVSKEEIRS